MLVVPLAVEQRLRRAVQTHDLGDTPALRGEPVELCGIEIGELPVRGDQRLLGGGMVRD